MYSKELVKGTIKPIILKMLSEKDSMYGYEIVQAVKALSQGKIHIKEGSLYPILHALKNYFLVHSPKPHKNGEKVSKQ